MKKRKHRFHPPRFSTILGKDAVIRGDVIFGGGLHLDGQVQGNVIASADDSHATLTVSEEGRIEGDVRVANIILNGAIHGDVYATERVELAEQARVTGKVHYRLLEMAMGAEVNGELVREDEVSASPVPGLAGREEIEDEEDRPNLD
jgi:cytoskeletal protein CcmA (bactofilin family)